MGQKVNPTILRMNKMSDWKSLYLEKKKTDSKIYNFKDIELRNFIIKYFYNNQLTVHNLKTFYSLNDLTIHLSYFSTIQSTLFIKSGTQKNKIRINSFKKRIKRKKFKYRFKERITHTNYNELKYLKNFKNFYYKNEKLHKNSKSIYTKRWTLKRIPSLQHYKSSKKITDKKFLESFFLTLTHFTSNKYKINLITQKLNHKAKLWIKKRNIKPLKETFIKLRKYKRSKFFNEGINTIYLTLKRKNSEKMLADFIAKQFKNLARHNYFLRFIKSSLKLLNSNSFSVLNGIKIKIKGRFNKAPRARHRIINIGKEVPNLTINAKIKYAESTAFTPAGTFGIKVWLYEK